MRLKLPFQKCFFASLFFVIAFNLNAQKNDEESINFINLQLIGILNDDDNPFFNGKINLKDGNSLTGKISLNYKKKGEYVTVLNQNGLHSYISNEKINDVILISGDNLETTFTVIKDNNLLYREVFKKNKDVIVYDTSVMPFENKLAAQVFVKENDSLTNTFNFWTSGSKKDLVNYINNRDGLQYKSRDFKSLEDLFLKL